MLFMQEKCQRRNFIFLDNYAKTLQMRNYSRLFLIQNFWLREFYI